MSDEPRIKKIRLSSGQEYVIFDEKGLHLDSNGTLLTGDDEVDSIISLYNLKIKEINDIPVEQSIEKVLVRDAETGELKQKILRDALKDLKVITFDDIIVTNNILEFGYN